MKTEQIGYALIVKNSQRYTPERLSIQTIDAQMPIFWNKNVAQEEADKYNLDIAKVIIKRV